MEHGSGRDEMFELEVKVEAFSSKDAAGRKSYTKGRVFKWNIEYGSMTLELLLKALATELNLTTNQTPTVCFYDKILKEDARLVDEIQMIDLFDMYKEEMCCLVVVQVFDREKCVEPDFDDLEPLCAIFPEPAAVKPQMQAELEAGAAANMPKQHRSSKGAVDDLDPLCATLEPAVVEPQMQAEIEADEIEPDREPDMFDNAEEYVGVNDEGMYGTLPAAPLFDTANCASNIQPNAKSVHVEAEVDDVDPLELHVLHDPKNPKIAKGELFPDIIAFRKAIRHFAVNIGFEFAPGVITDKTKFRAKCAAEGCPWRIHASTIFDKKTVQIKVLPAAHNCATTKLREGKMASQSWCADRLGDWVKKNPRKGAKDAKEKLEGDYGIKLKYSKAWSGLKLALDQIHGKYEESFQLLFNWAAQLVQSSPGSHVEIEVEKIGGKNRFKRIFVALKPCIDGFLAGCRPFVGVDASFLHGKYTGQLASATGVDGHNWLYHIAYGVFDSETEDNWTWFLENLHKVIGDPPGLVLCSDACKGLENAIEAVFPLAENRECMRHMYSNFMKHYTGDVFTEHLYPAARSYREGLFKWHIEKIYEFAPEAIEYLDKHHPRIWYRSGFSEDSKCDYLTNNVAESFNSQIKHLKGLNLHELVDRIRELIIEKRFIRKKIANEWEDGVLPNVKKDLNLISNNLKVVKVATSDEHFAEVTLLDDYNNQKRHVVDLKNKTCGCREWQITGKPCKHALAWICSNRGIKIDDYVHDFYSVARFRAAYAGRVEAMPDRSQWPEVDLGFKIYPPLLGRAPGRPKVQRTRGCLEKNANKKKVRCKRCNGFGHFSKTCKLGMVGENGETASTNKRKAPEDATPGPSKGTTKMAAKKKRTPKKKKTPVKKKQKRDAAAPPPKVVKSLKALFSVGESSSMQSK